MKKIKLVMVGNGMAGVRTLEELLRIAPDLYDITVFGAEPHPNYNRILLSPVLAGEQTLDEIVLNPLAWYERHGITLHLGQAVTKIDQPNSGTLCSVIPGVRMFRKVVIMLIAPDAILTSAVSTGSNAEPITSCSVSTASRTCLKIGPGVQPRSIRSRPFMRGWGISGSLANSSSFAWRK